MSLTTARVFGIIATVLFALAFLFVLLVIPFQEQIKMLYTQDPEVIRFHSVPVGAIILSLLELLVAGVYLILILALKPTKAGSIAVVIVFAALILLNGVLISPAISLISQASVNAYGVRAAASNSALNGFASAGRGFLSAPAVVLMYLSMGGYWGKTAVKRI